MASENLWGEVKLCLYCTEVLGKGEDYVVVREAHQGTPSMVAHLKCHQKELRELG